MDVNNWPLQSDTVNAVVIIAHPDDETIFCGGTLLVYPRWNWKIICLTRNIDENPRGTQFRSAMDFFKALGVNIVSYQCLGNFDNGQELTQEEINDWSNDISSLNLTPDIVITHNTEGEYGHNHNRHVNRIVKGLFSNAWEIICPGAVNIAPQPFKPKTTTIPLTNDTLNKKTEIFNRCYTSELACWKVLPEIMQFEFRTGPEIFTSD